MKKPLLSFRVIGDSGPLSVYWYPGPYGDAVESRKGNGVGWFSPTGEILGVEFDDVAKNSDHQSLEFSGGLSVEVTTKKGHASVKLKTPQHGRKKTG